MAYNSNFVEANASHPPPPLLDSGQLPFPSGSKLAQYLHGAANYTRPPPPIGMCNAEAESSINYPLSQMNISGGVGAISGMDGTDEDRVSAFLNGDYANSPLYYANQTAGDMTPSMDEYHTCTAYYDYQGLPSHVWKNRLKQQPTSSFFVDPCLKAELVSRQMCLCPSSSEEYSNLPANVEQFYSLTPLNDQSRDPKSAVNGAIGTYRAVKATDGLMYCLKRVSTGRPLSQKQLFACENWKRLSHSNVVQLKEVIQTRAFNDSSFLFVYDFHPLAETLKSYHFGKGANDQYSLLPKHAAGPNFTGLPENVIWTYVVQLSSAIRYIHSCGLAIRFMDISKLLICGKSKLMINCCGIDDVLQGDNGRNIVAQQDQMASSMQYIDQHVSMDLKNAIHLLYGARNIAGHKVTSINEIMPMIGARFYSQIENLQIKNDFLEDELSKELENGRLFRIMCKLNTVNERPDLNMDAMWSETGDRYLLKLFRDYVFHQVTENGKAWIDFSHITSCLNKLDAGVEENVPVGVEKRRECTHRVVRRAAEMLGELFQHSSSAPVQQRQPEQAVWSDNNGCFNHNNNIGERPVDFQATTKDMKEKNLDDDIIQFVYILWLFIHPSNSLLVHFED